MERSDGDFNLRVPLPEEPDADTAEQTRQAAITASREKYAKPRADVEAELFAQYRQAEQKSAAKQPLPKEKPKPAEAFPHVAPSEPAKPEPAPVPKTEPPVPSAQAPAEPKPASPPSDMGRGGAQHQAIQQRIKTAAEGLGYRVTVEKQLQNPLGSVDLALESTGTSIACEISVTTSIDHEFGNVKKCLAAGFVHVAVITGNPARLGQIAEAVKAALSAEEAARVGYYSPDEFITSLPKHLAEAPKADPTTPAERQRRGYKVRLQVTPLTPEERQARETAGLTMLADAMRTRPRKKKSQ
ncbi:MAG: hypothetical protein EBS05_25745 [Proteobacteria bacterium]|nr:hypothetical protein [Pseudomonadota bacterium]